MDAQPRSIVGAWFCFFVFSCENENCLNDICSSSVPSRKTVSQSEIFWPIYIYINPYLYM